MKYKESSLTNVRHLITELYWLGMANSIVMRELKGIEKDLEVLEILKKHIELEKEDSDPNDECAFYEDVLYMNLNLEQDLSSDEYKIIKQWLEEKK